jgi:Ca-activated chloride channel homolog
MLKDNKHRVFYLFVSIALLLSLLLSAGCSAITGGDNPPSNPPTVGTTITTVPKTHGSEDDWELPSDLNPPGVKSAPTVTRLIIPPSTYSSGPMTTAAPMVTPTLTVVMPAPTTTSIMVPGGNENLGFSTGGAKDIQNFRENIQDNYLPLPSDVTYEGLFYDYYFDTGTLEATDKLFAPSYSAAVSRDPISGGIEYYLSVGLNSGMKESDFARKKLNLVVVLDVSGSMNEAFNSYYYDGNGNKDPEEEGGKSKIAVARESVVALLDHLNDGDSFGMVVFNDNAHLAKPLSSVAVTDIDAIQRHILDITATGSTNLEAGKDMAADLLKEKEGTDTAEYENRIIFLTDAQPNTGDISRYGFFGAVNTNVQNHIYSTFIGVGVDFNSNLVESVSKVRGANYYSVHSSREFKKRMDHEFDYMVTPLVFNLQLKLESEGWEIEQVYGSPEADRATGELMKVNTLFPSKSEGGQTRGGLVLLKLRRTGEDNRIVLKTSYEDRTGKYGSSEVAVNLTERAAEYFGNDGIRKGVLLSRYADLLKTWMADERDHSYFRRSWLPSIDEHSGIFCPPHVYDQWERTSLPLRVSGPYRQLFRDFRDYFKREAGRIGDTDLD